MYNPVELLPYEKIIANLLAYLVELKTANDSLNTNSKFREVNDCQAYIINEILTKEKPDFYYHICTGANYQKKSK
jgi:hypothetical protein